MLNSLHADFFISKMGSEVFIIPEGVYIYIWYTVPTTKLRTSPSFYVYSYGATCLIATPSHTKPSPYPFNFFAQKVLKKGRFYLSSQG